MRINENNDTKIWNSRLYPFKFFEGCLPQTLLDPLLSTLSNSFLTFCWVQYLQWKQNVPQSNIHNSLLSLNRTLVYDIILWFPSPKAFFSWFLTSKFGNKRSNKKWWYLTIFFYRYLLGVCISYTRSLTFFPTYDNYFPNHWSTQNSFTFGIGPAGPFTFVLIY